MTTSSLAVLHEEVSSIVYCAELCSEDDYCMEFLYSDINRQCIALHCVKKESYSCQYFVLGSTQMLHYEKELNWVEYSGHLYLYGEEKLTWEDAKLECQKKCAHLVQIETKEESDWLAATFLNDDCLSDIYFYCTAWTGGNDLDIEGQFVWGHSNTSMVFTNWYVTEPSINNPSLAAVRDCIDILRNANCGSDLYVCSAWTGLNDQHIEGQYRWDHLNTSLSLANWHPEEPSLVFPSHAAERDCIDMLSNGLWNDRPCSYLNSVICEKSFKN
uniref:Aggrecan core protein n=1 Tax=Magallana gigas TaxID=29159 RepID=K1QUK2_MAGGI